VANLFVVEDSKEAGNLPEWCCTFREAIRGHLDVLARGAFSYTPGALARTANTGSPERI
jgi:hypothetical protein